MEAGLSVIMEINSGCKRKNSKGEPLVKLPHPVYSDFHPFPSKSYFTILPIINMPGYHMFSCPYRRSRPFDGRDTDHFLSRIMGTTACSASSFLYRCDQFTPSMRE
jgi:hypothetical protein